MKKPIFFSLAFVAILAPNVALSQTPLLDITEVEALNMSDKEAKIVNSLICKYEDSSKENLIEELSNVDNTISDAKKEDLANAVLLAEKMPEALENTICRP